MYVCICLAVKETEIVNAINDGHTSVDSIAEVLGAGTCCGSCRPVTKAIIDEVVKHFDPRRQRSPNQLAA